MKSMNFEFLRPSFPELADLGVVAERYTFSEPASALIKLRMFAETAKCDRMSMGIGSDVDESVLSAFIAGTPHPLYRAANAGQLHEFFRHMTMSVSMRVSSKTPNEIPGGINLTAVEGASAVGKPSSPSAPPFGSASEEAYW